MLPASGLLAALALALTGLISSPPPIAAAPANEIAIYFARHHIGPETESIADSGFLAAGGIPDVVAFSALLVWLIASSLAMLIKPAPGERHPMAR